MGRELQKKKNKSSIPKKRQNGPSKKKILQNPIIAKHWYELLHKALHAFTDMSVIGTSMRHSPRTTAVSASHRA
jgi:hypothetical protein